MIPRSLVFLFVLLWCQAGFATTVVYVDVPEMTRASALILHGSVETVHTRNLGTAKAPRIVTDIKLRVHRVLKGKNRGPEFTLRLIGGTIDGQSMKVPGTPAFRPEEEVLLFLEWTGENFTLCGLAQGKFTIDRDHSDKPQAHRSLEGLCVLKTDSAQPNRIEHASGPEAPIALDSLLTTIRTHLR
jgi:hypothetical protein